MLMGKLGDVAGVPAKGAVAGQKLGANLLGPKDNPSQLGRKCRYI